MIITKHYIINYIMQNTMVNIIVYKNNNNINLPIEMWNKITYYLSVNEFKNLIIVLKLLNNKTINDDNVFINRNIELMTQMYLADYITENSICKQLLLTHKNLYNIKTYQDHIDYYNNIFQSYEYSKKPHHEKLIKLYESIILKTKLLETIELKNKKKLFNNICNTINKKFSFLDYNNISHKWNKHKKLYSQIVVKYLEYI